MRLAISRNKIEKITIGVVTIIYVANCFTPLRLTHDTIRYFTLAGTIEGSLPSYLDVHGDFLPIGYVFFLLSLSKLKILNSFAICMCHMAYLAGSLYFIKRIFPLVKTTLLVIFILLNWSTIRYAITPLSEMQFLFFSTGSLYFYRQFELTRKLKFLLSLAIFCILSILTRTVGFVLVFALLIAFVIENRNTLLEWMRARIVLAACMIIAAIAVTLFFLRQPKFIVYCSYFIKPFTQNTAHFFTENINLHLIDWAELFLNIPISKTNFLLSVSWTRILYMAAGIFFLVIILFRFFDRRLGISLYIKVYLISYFLLIFNWPFFEARFWFPILPILMGLMLLPKNRSSSPVYNNVMASYRFYYIVTGIFVLCYYTYLSFNKDEFARRHDAGLWQAEYEMHFYGKTTQARATNKKALYILDKYD